jgi:hypothetical protein
VKQRLSPKKEARIAQALGRPIGAAFNRGGSPGIQVYGVDGKFLGYVHFKTYALIDLMADWRRRNPGAAIEYDRTRAYLRSHGLIP